MTVKDLPKADRPREKIFTKGAQHLSDRELLMVILGSGSPGDSVMQSAERLLGRFKNIRRLAKATADEMASVKGIGPANAARIKAALELSKRISSDDTVEPFIKWAGGKSQLLDQLAHFFPPPQSYNKYIEPFLGGGAVYFHLKPKNAVLTDLNGDLIKVYTTVRNNPRELLDHLQRHQENHSKTHYENVRSLFNTRELSRAAHAAAFIYLNKTGFNGLFRVNSKGEFNVPFGHHKNPSIYSEKNIHAGSRLLKSAILKHGSYELVLDYAKKGDFIYFDPPYHPLNATSNFTSYTKEDFGPRDQERLSEVFRLLDRMDCKVMLSNSDTEFIRNLYKGFRIEIVQASRFINCDGKKRGKVNEVVVMNY